MADWVALGFVVVVLLVVAAIVATEIKIRINGRKKN